jgi:hypothetical protein
VRLERGTATDLIVLDEITGEVGATDLPRVPAGGT